MYVVNDIAIDFDLIGLNARQQQQARRAGAKIIDRR